jgi:putative ABC transport system substrate-binding protein
MFIGTPDRGKWWVDAWNKTMGEAGFVEGQNLVAEYRWGDGDPSKMPSFAADLVARRVAVIVSTTEPAAAAAKQATSTIPIVFNNIHDPVGKGFVTSVARPGGNITGIGELDEGALESKRLQLLQEVIPAVTLVGHLIAEQDVAGKRGAIDAVAAAGRKLGIEVVLLTAGKVEDLDPTFAAAGQRRIGAILVGSPSSFLYARQKRILETATRYKMPIVSGNIDFALDGGLMQYGVVRTEVPILTANYVVRILKGQKPAELPVQQPTRFALALNLKSAKALGLAFPPGLISSADEVIE